MKIRYKFQSCSTISMFYGNFPGNFMLSIIIKSKIYFIQSFVCGQILRDHLLSASFCKTTLYNNKNNSVLYR